MNQDSGRFCDLASRYAVNAHGNPLDAACRLDSPDLFKVGVPTPFGHVMGVAHLVAEHRLLAADIALSSHGSTNAFSSVKIENSIMKGGNGNCFLSRHPLKTLNGLCGKRDYPLCRTDIPHVKPSVAARGCSLNIPYIRIHVWHKSGQIARYGAGRFIGHRSPLFGALTFERSRDKLTNLRRDLDPVVFKSGAFFPLPSQTARKRG